jgi:hypothetical protein
MPKYRRGSGGVYKKGKSFWFVYYHAGKQVWENAKTTDKAEARRLLQAKIGQLAEGRYVGPAVERVTMQELFADLETDYAMNEKRSLDKLKIRIQKHLLPFFGLLRAQKLTTADVKNFITKRQAVGASNAEINRELAALKRAFNLALQAEKITRKPFIPSLEEDNVRQGFFEPQDFDAVLAKLPAYLHPPPHLCLLDRLENPQRDSPPDLGPGRP